MQIEQFGLVPGHQAPLGLVVAVDGEDLTGGPFQRSSELGDPSTAVGQRLKVPGQMAPACLALLRIDPGVGAVAIADEDALEILAEQVLGHASGARVGQVVDGDPLGAGQPRPASGAGPASASRSHRRARPAARARRGQAPHRRRPSRRCALADRLHGRRRHRAGKVVADELRDLLSGHVRTERHDRRAQVWAKRPGRRSRRHVGERDLAAARAAPPQPLMFGHTADDRRQLPHLMADRLTDRLTIDQIAATAVTVHGLMLDRLIRVGDHLPMTALMTPLATRPPTRRLTPRTLRRPAAGRWTAAGSCCWSSCPNCRRNSLTSAINAATCSCSDAFSALNSPSSSRRVTLHNYAPDPEMPAQTPRPPEYVPTTCPAHPPRATRSAPRRWPRTPRHGENPWPPVGRNMATSGEFRWPPIYGEKPMAVDTPSLRWDH